MTKEEAKEYLDNYRKMYAELAPEEFLEALDVMLNQPSLPSNVDEAATKYAEGEYNKKDPSALPNRCRACYAPLKYAFKAGAEYGFSKGYQSGKKDTIERVMRWVRKYAYLYTDTQNDEEGNIMTVFLDGAFNDALKNAMKE